MGNACNTEDPSMKNSKKKKQLQGTMTSEIKKPSLQDFERIMQLGKGGYGVVYLVKHRAQQKVYAMKVIKKTLIKKESTARHLKDERKVLERVNSPFLTKLKYAFQDKQHLYLIVNYMDGGELFYHLRKVKTFPINIVKFYAAEILLGLKDLHDLNIIYRDMKPENILLNRKGHIKLADFGLAKIMVEDERAYSLCGTPEYLAPEVLISKTGYEKTCDYYSYGCIVYEMLVGHPPFYNKDKRQMIQDRIAKKIDFSAISDPTTKSFLSSLLQLDPKDRLGSHGIQDIMNHSFFQLVDFDSILKAQPPYEFDKRDYAFFESAKVKDFTVFPHQSNYPIQNFTEFTYEGNIVISQEATEIDL